MICNVEIALRTLDRGFLETLHEIAGNSSAESKNPNWVSSIPRYKRRLLTLAQREFALPKVTFPIPIKQNELSPWRGRRNRNGKVMSIL